MKKKLYFVVIAFAMLICMYSCTKDKTAPASALNCSTVNAAQTTYSSGNGNISNILNIWCAYAPCHGGGSAQNGISFATYTSTVNSFKNNNVICALEADGCILMPNGGPQLPDSTILQIECWQANGYTQ